MADIQVTGFALDNYRGAGTAAYLQVVSESDWVDADGDSHRALSYDEIPLAVNAATHRIDETNFTLTPTQNALVNQLATYRFQVVDSARKNPLVLAQGVSVPYSTPVMAWGSLLLLASSQSPWRDVTSPTTTDMVNYVQSQLSAVVLPDASASVAGKTKLSVDPAGPPVAVGDNDTRLISALTQAALAALAAITGTLKYVADGIRGHFYKTVSGLWVSLTGRVNVFDFGARGDVVDVQTGGATASSTSITGAVGIGNADVGKTFVLQGAGVAGAPLVGTITAANPGASSFTSSVAASTTVSNKELYWGTDDTAAFAAALAACPAWGKIVVPQTPGGYIANINITKGVHIEGLGNFRPRRIGTGANYPTSYWDEITGVVIRTGGATDVLTLTDVQGVVLSNIIFDGARLSPWAVSLDRARFCDFRNWGAARGATGGVRLGASASTTPDPVDDGSFHNTFTNTYISSSPTGLAFVKWGTSITGAYLNRFFGLNIEYNGQGTDDCGIAFQNGDSNHILCAFVVDHINASVKPAVRIWPFVNEDSAYDNIIDDLCPDRGGIVVDAGNPFAGEVRTYQQAGGNAPNPVIGAGSRLNVYRRGAEDGSGNQVEGETHYCINDSFAVLSGKATPPCWTGVVVGRASPDGGMLVSDSPALFLSDDTAGDIVFRENDPAKALRFGFLGGHSMFVIQNGVVSISPSALPVFANNAAAVAANRGAGSLYRTGGDPDLICVVH